MSTPASEGLILTRGDDYLVALKPAGLATTGRTLDDPDCLQGQLMWHLKRRKVWAVHQLDKGTSGLCLFALRKPSVSLWAERLRAGRKVYLGLVDGALAGTHEVHEPIGRVTLPDGRTQAGLVKDGKTAHSTVRALGTAGGRTVVAVEIHTGRTHQVRLHLGHLGHPLVGERMHRTPPCTAMAFVALHGWLVSLQGPDAATMRWEAPVPEALARAVEAAGLALPSPKAVGMWDDHE
ncbi:MAG: pseudouridine synthase [Myxococcota bacterium]|jgi:23S rRNA pseudouridine1911/1915/1917 synthase|nr:pseudouridine synthase [Myxococcota bacterium]